MTSFEVVSLVLTMVLCAGLLLLIWSAGVKVLVLLGDKVRQRAHAAVLEGGIVTNEAVLLLLFKAPAWRLDPARNIQLLCFDEESCTRVEFEGWPQLRVVKSEYCESPSLSKTIYLRPGSSWKPVRLTFESGGKRKMIKSWMSAKDVSAAREAGLLT